MHCILSLRKYFFSPDIDLRQSLIECFWGRNLNSVSVDWNSALYFLLRKAILGWYTNFWQDFIRVLPADACFSRNQWNFRISRSQKPLIKLYRKSIFRRRQTFLVRNEIHSFDYLTPSWDSSLPKTFDQTLSKVNISAQKGFLSEKMNFNIYHFQQQHKILWTSWRKVQENEDCVLLVIWLK